MYKRYQNRMNAELAQFCELARSLGAASAFTKMTGKPYRGTGEAPRVANKSGTGSGKTLMAVRGMGTIAKSFCLEDPIVAIIFAPSDIIVSQTLADLRNPNHMLHRALHDAFGELVTVLDIKEASRLNLTALQSGPHVICTTVQAFNVQKKEGRRVYSPREGDISLTGLLASVHPLIVIDEAHLNQTSLFRSVIDNLNPAFVIEWTATPAAQNDVLATVTAMELKEANMIKLPLRVQVEPDGIEAALTHCVSVRDRLEELAKSTNRPIRPIALIGAEDKTGEYSVEKALELLTGEHRIPRNQIAVAISEEDELFGIDLEAPDCQIRYIVTVQKLREGWNCPWAYCYCPLREIRSQTAKEQFLGRICRLPNATPFEIEELNQSYVFAHSDNFETVVQSIREGLEACGYSSAETQDWVKPLEPLAIQTHFELPPQLPFTALPTPASKNLRIEVKDGKSVVVVAPNIRYAELVTELDMIDRNLSEPERAIFAPIKAEIRKIRCNQESPAERGEHFPPLPQIYIDTSIGTELVVGKTLNRFLKWDEIELPKVEITANPAGRVGFIDLLSGQWIDLPASAANIVAMQSEFLAAEKNPQNLIGQLVSKIKKLIGKTITEISHQKIVRWVREQIDDFLVNKADKVINLFSNRNRLAQLFADKLTTLRNDRLELIFVNNMGSFHIRGVPYPVGDAKEYRPNVEYRASFKKHFFPVVGELNAEEARYARKLDNDPRVKFWIRNSPTSHARSGAEGYAFFLPIPGGRFFPDFVVLMEDGTISLDEYKGEMLLGSDDTMVKERSGKLWAKLSNNAFAIRTKDDL